MAEESITKINAILTCQVEESSESEIIKNKIIEKITKKKRFFTKKVV